VLYVELVGLDVARVRTFLCLCLGEPLAKEGESLKQSLAARAARICEGYGEGFHVIAAAVEEWNVTM